MMEKSGRVRLPGWVAWAGALALPLMLGFAVFARDKLNAIEAGQANMEKVLFKLTEIAEQQEKINRELLIWLKAREEFSRTKKRNTW